MHLMVVATMRFFRLNTCTHTQSHTHNGIISDYFSFLFCTCISPFSFSSFTIANMWNHITVLQLQSVDALQPKTTNWIRRIYSVFRARCISHVVDARNITWKFALHRKTWIKHNLMCNARPAPAVCVSEVEAAPIRVQMAKFNINVERCDVCVWVVGAFWHNVCAVRLDLYVLWMVSRTAHTQAKLPLMFPNRQFNGPTMRRMYIYACMGFSCARVAN